MKKWTAVLLTGAMFAATCLGGTITAFAGVTTEKPIGGKGLVSGTGINNKFTVEDDGAPSSYEVVAGDLNLNYKASSTEAIINKAVPKETMAKDDVTVAMTYVFKSVTPETNELVFVPAVKSVEEIDTYAIRLSRWRQIWQVPSLRTSATDGDPEMVVNGTEGAGTWQDGGESAKFVSVGVWEEDIAAITATEKLALLRFEMTVNGNGWVDVTMKAAELGTTDWSIGNSAVKYVTVTNVAHYDNTADFRANLFVSEGTGVSLDGAKLEVSYTDGGQAKNDVLFESRFDEEAEFVTGASDAAKDGCFLARGATVDAATDSEVVVTNPQADSRLVSKSSLTAVEGIEETFNLKAHLRFYEMAEGKKVGIAFGLKDKDAKLSAPGTDVTFLYLTKSGTDTNQLAVGVDNIAADGAVTPVTPKEGEAKTSLDKSIIKAVDPSYAKFTIVGNSATSFTVTVSFGKKGLESVLTFENVHLNGRFAFTQTGDGNAKFGIKGDSVKLTSSALTENEGEKVTANFNGDYIDYGKFDVQSNLAAAGQMQKRPTTAHDITGITPENGKVGFYGTGTNTRLMFKKQYSDFVLQFDYISETYKQRGESLVESKIYNPLMMTFGVKGDGSIQTLDAGYGIAIIDGNPGQDQWGGESIVMCHAATKCAREGLSGDAYTKVLSTLKVAEGGESDTTIRADTGALAGTWCEPDFDPAAGGYSFYNRTTRIKLVVLNNKFTVYIAPVETDGSVGDYREVLTGVVSDSKGYVGFATDSPAWCAIDNVAITPISKDVAIAQAANPDYDETIVPDIAPADMDTDIAPAPLDKPQLTVDGTKVKWQAYEEGLVAHFHVVVTLDGETKIDKLYVNPEADLSSLTTPGTYTVKVTVVPEDPEFHFESSATITYTVAEPAPEEPENKGCGSAIGGWAAGGILLTAAAAVLIALPRRKKNK